MDRRLDDLSRAIEGLRTALKLLVAMARGIDGKRIQYKTLIGKEAA